MLAYARICGPVGMAYGSSEINRVYEYRHRCMHSCLLTADKMAFFFSFFCLFVCFNIHFYWYNLLIQVVSMIVVRSV